TFVPRTTYGAYLRELLDAAIAESGGRLVHVEGEFGNIAYARATQRITFAKARQARYLMLGFTTVATAQPKMAIAGIGAFRP
ncbi:MAG: hypothetical protein EOP68_08335, partial [Sphingomonas sp.]